MKEPLGIARWGMVTALLAGCEPPAGSPPGPPGDAPTPPPAAGRAASDGGVQTGRGHHPRLDLAFWTRRFPLATFERRTGPRRFESTRPGDPLDLWKAHGEIVTSPAELCVIEQVRQRLAGQRSLGRAVPVDVFVWAAGPPARPYLTKVGGIPHRERSQPWPRTAAGTPYTFVAQFCFLDSTDIVRRPLPGEVLLVFFKDVDSGLRAGPDDIRVEWSRRALQQPLRPTDAPAPAFRVPELAGVIHRTRAYPDSGEAFEQAGHYQWYLFPVSQSTKIGRATYFIQNDPRRRGQQLLCALNSIQPDAAWPFTNMERLPAGRPADDYQLMFGDVGCIYFMIDTRGRVRWASDCY